MVPPSIDDAAILGEVIRRRLPPARPVLQQHQTSILDCYRTYGSLWHQAHRKSSIDVTEAEMLLLKKVMGDSFDFARDQGLLGSVYPSTGRKDCPLCGTARATQIDHYLPQSIFPEYALYATNLVPVCPACNLLKGNKLAESSSKRFLHPYFDLTAPQQVLQADIKIQSEISIIYCLEMPSAQNDPVIDLYSFHMSSLDLYTSFQRAANVELYDRRFVYQELFEAGGADLVQDYLQREARNFSKARGINDWKTVLYKALSVHHEFVNGGCAVMWSIP